MRIVATAVRGIDNTTDNPEIDALLAASWQDMGAQLNSVGSAQQHPFVAPWRDALRNLGINGKKYPCAIESMVRRAFKSPEPLRLNPLTDFIHSLSLRHVVPLGAFDADDIGGGELELRRTREDDLFQPLDAPEAVPVEPNEVAYAWRNQILTRHFVWRQAAQALIRRETTNAIIVVELLDQVDETATKSFITELHSGLEKFFGPASFPQVLDSDDSRAVLT